MTHTDILCELTELLVVYNAGQDTCQKSLSLSWIALGDVGSDNETQYTVSEELELFVVALAEGKTIVGAWGNHHLFSVLGVLLP